MRFIKDHGETVEFECKFPGMHSIAFVKKEFLNVVPEPWNPGTATPEEHFIDLYTKHKMASYLHNLRGPAVYNPETNVEQYLIEGKKIVDEAIIAKMKHDGTFQEKFIGELTTAANDK